MKIGFVTRLFIYFFILASVITWMRRDQILFSLSPQATVDPATLTSFYDPYVTTAYFDNQLVSVPTYLADIPQPQVLGWGGGPKRIEVDLTSQRLYAYEGGQMIYSFLISSGKWGRTPTGIFRVWTKLRYTKMEGGSRQLATYYNLPNVPFVMFFYNEKTPKMAGYSTHGTYWHSNFGHPMSHGCINMKTEEAGLLYYWANPELRGKTSIAATENNLGTEIYIYGKSPEA